MQDLDLDSNLNVMLQIDKLIPTRYKKNGYKQSKDHLITAFSQQLKHIKSPLDCQAVKNDYDNYIKPQNNSSNA